MSDPQRGTVRAPEFRPGLEWLNVPEPLALAALRGRVVLLHFWTYGGIDCLHGLSQLRRIEEAFPGEVAVIGVHSAKFPAEESLFNLRQAVMRHDVRHPVVRDEDFVVWRSYGVRAWPSLVIVDPLGRAIGRHEGEFEAGPLVEFLGSLLADFRGRGELDAEPLPMLLERRRQLSTLLSFPQGLAVDPEGDRLFVADTDHHRVLQFALRSGRLQKVWGGEPGLQDGSLRARFDSPRGLALDGDRLFVADTGNHALRAIELTEPNVSTLFAPGSEADERPGPRSPWDVLASGDWLFVAMAGSHQLWRLHLPSGALKVHAGDGREGMRDAEPDRARLAQPSALAAIGDTLYFADSETSSVRSVPLFAEGKVRTLIGVGLFEFGDRDGARDTARLQHPLGLAAAEDLLFVADSYNHRIKVLDPRQGIVRAFSGCGEPGLQNGPAEDVSFWEPSAIRAAGDVLYVADTNNHAIRRVELYTGAAETLDLRE